MDVIILVFAFVIVIVALGVGGGSIKAYFESKRSRADERVSDDVAAQVERLDRLEERIEVLERIVTDERHELERRFRQL